MDGVGLVVDRVGDDRIERAVAGFLGAVSDPGLPVIPTDGTVFRTAERRVDIFDVLLDTALDGFVDEKSARAREDTLERRTCLCNLLCRVRTGRHFDPIPEVVAGEPAVVPHLAQLNPIDNHHVVEAGDQERK